MAEGPPRILVMAGSDSGGGAGVQGDIKTITALGGYAATALTAITVQNTLGVSAVETLAPGLIAAQARAVLQDLGADAIKTGMLGDAAGAGAVAEILEAWPDIPAVIDPVQLAKGGHVLLDAAGLDILRRRLIPRARLLTPNIPEAEVLTGQTIASLDDRRRAGEALLSAGAAAVLIKGGHAPGDRVVDLLITPRGETLFEAERVVSRHTHGTGCALASACAVGLARGRALEQAVAEAWAYVAEAIRRAPGLGAGAGPLAHAWPGLLK
jgi:hydroxymethylpyrimidine/phosphomethylpyrimidine kinase